MVRYRPETGERGYTFRLNSNADGNAVNGVSPTGTLMSDHSTSTLDSSIYKERIDSLFRQLHQQQNRKNRVHIQEEDDDEVSNPAVDNEEPTMEHLQLHFQKVLIEQRRGGASHVSPVHSSMKNNSANTTYIHVNNQINSNHIKEMSNNSDPNNQKTRASFIQARNAVQAQIEKMFQDASLNQQQNNKQPTSGQQQHQPQYPSDLKSSVTINNKAVISVRVDAAQKPLPSCKVHIKQNVPLPPIPKQPVSPVQIKKLAPTSASIGSGTTEQQQQQPPPPPSTNTYKVDYLGSVALAGRATSLETLQFPLKDLYSKYRQSLNSNNATQSYRGAMEISPAGLRIQYHSRMTAAATAASQRRSLPLQEILNPFPTIAVWAAVKFVARGDTPSVRKFAFMPLICDPENQDKQNLFHPLSAADDGEWVTCPAFHPPLFTCVMRNASAPKSLECHAFVCDNPEDAIVIAANLYQALLRNMKNNEKQSAATTTVTSMTTTSTAVTSKAAIATTTSSSANIPKAKPTPIHSNGVHQQQPIYSPSTSMSNWSESSVTSAPFRQQQQQPVRPPRRKKSSKNSEGLGIASGAGLEKRKSIRRSHSKTRSSMGKANLRRSMRSASQRSAGRVKRSVSERQLGEMLSADVIDGSVDNGDILSKVAIPRSKSFMTVPQQNYSFAELLEELKKQEGIKSVDDVLKMIVNKDRMSFNDLTPAYKEMLMKLALTLSKDEMFQRSKNIMRHQTSSWNSKPSSKVTGTNSGNNKLAPATSNGIKASSKSSERDSDAEHSTSSSRISSVLRATKKSFSKWGGRSASTGYSITKDSDKQEPLLLKNISRLDISEPVNRAPVSVTSSSRQQQHQIGNSNPNSTRGDFSLKTPLPPRIVQSSNSNHVAAGLIHKTAPNKNDCMSCSDSCGYDSESCSHKCYCSLNESQSQAASDLYSSDGERCYCSLRRINKSSGAPVYRIRLDSDDTDTSQDSLSVPVKVEPVKQFQQNQSNSSKSGSHKSRTNYARKSQSMTSWSALSGAESPMTAWRRNTANLNQQPPNTMRKTPSNGNISMTTFLPSNALSLRQKSLSSYLSDTSLDSDVVAMTEPAQHKSFTKHSDALRRKSRSSYLSSETELESVTTTSCNSFVRGTVPSIQQQQQQQRKHSPAESVVTYQSYDSTGSSGGRNSRNFSSENLSTVSDDRRNSNSSSSLKSQNSGRGNKFLVVSAVDPKGKIVYRGTSSAGTSHHGKQHRITSKSVPEGALAAKKTTEIAAMFSNIKLNQTTDIIIDDSEATEDTASELSTDDAYSSMRFRINQGKNKAGFTKSMENSLGYLP